jgi:hypothetical protein
MIDAATWVHGVTMTDSDGLLSVDDTIVFRSIVFRSIVFLSVVFLS